MLINILIMLITATVVYLALPAFIAVLDQHWDNYKNDFRLKIRRKIYETTYKTLKENP